MIHSKAVNPRIYPNKSSESSAQINRAQDIGGDLTLNREKQYEIGRDGILGYKKNIPSFSYSMTQFENGDMAFWSRLSGLEDPSSAGLDNSIDLDDLKTPTCEITASLTDDSSAFRGSIWFPKLRVNGFSLNIGDPDAIVERSFDLVGEDYKILDAKYFSVEQVTVAAPGDEAITLAPAAIEWASGDYVFKVIRVRAGVDTQLVEDATGATADTWKFLSNVVTVQDCLTSDIVKVYYPSTTADAATAWVDDNTSADFLTADSCEIFLKVGTSTKIHKLQSIGIDVAFERTDYKEIGNKEVVQTGVKSKTVTVSLDKFADDCSLEDILAGDTTYPYIDPREFSDSIKLMVKIYADNTKTVFKMGYLITDLSPTTLSTAQAVEDYNKRTNALEADNLKISNDKNEIIF